MIQRYDMDGYDGYMFETNDGEWVKWSDVEKLLALREAEAAELNWWRSSTWNNRDDIYRLEKATNAARRAANIKENA